MMIQQARIKSIYKMNLLTKSLVASLWLLLVMGNVGFSQSPSFNTFVNPIIPGDHPDPTLTQVGDYFYSSGSSFNPTPKLYRSKNLVHWEVIAQPVTSEWDVYGDEPGGGAWGGHTVLYNDTWWHYFGRGGGSMYFVTADDPEGHWSEPTEVNVPAGMFSLGVDNSIFIDDDSGNWYLLTKAGHANNHIVELGDDGQPTGEVLDLTWLNPEDEDGNHPYGWAEGPVMWEYDGFYYYSVAEHLVGEQYVMRSDSLTDDEEAWEIMDGDIYTGPTETFPWSNHFSPAVHLDDGTAWAIGHSYHSNEWFAQGRQGLLHRIHYDEDGWPYIENPMEEAEAAPDLPSGGIPWMVPKSDMFDSSELKPEWSVLGYTERHTISLTEREGWLHLQPRNNGNNTVIQNDGEHQYSLITKVDFEPESSDDEAGLWIFNGPETHHVKLNSTINGSGDEVLSFSFEDEYYEVENTVGSTVWLRLVRDEHMMSGYFSDDGHNWNRIGEQIDATVLGTEVAEEFNAFTGNQHGLYVEGSSAFFNLYIYRDAYSEIGAQYPANYFGVNPTANYLDGINDDDWALYAGVEFGSSDEEASYNSVAEEIGVIASSASSGGTVEVWLDSIDTGTNIADIEIENTGGWFDYELFTADVDEVSGRHDVYLRFNGTDGDDLFRLQSFSFQPDVLPTSAEDELSSGEGAYTFSLAQNYPNPFNPDTQITFTIPESSEVTLKVYDVMGRHIQTLAEGSHSLGSHTVTFDGSNLASGLYLYRLQISDPAGSGTATRTETNQMMLVK